MVSPDESDGVLRTSEDWIALSLRQAYFAIHRAAGSMVECEGVTAEQFMILMVLSLNEGTSQRQLGESTFTDANTLSAMLKLLEDKGLVERCENPSDRRARAVHLTDNGRLLVERLSADVAPFRRKIREVVGEENLPAFLACLRRLSRAAEDAAG